MNVADCAGWPHRDEPVASSHRNWRGDEADFRELGLGVEDRHRLTRRATSNTYVLRHGHHCEERGHPDGPVTEFSFGVGYVMTSMLRVKAAVGWGANGRIPNGGTIPVTGCSGGYGGAPLELHPGRQRDVAPGEP